MPGYGFSGKPTGTRYVAQGGDCGAFAVGQMGLQKPAGLLAIHTNMPATVPADVDKAFKQVDYARLMGSLWTTSTTGELTRAEILASITLYWLTNMGVSAPRLYWEYKGGFFNVKGVSIPVAVSVFPGEQYEAPRSWTEKVYPNLIHDNKLGKGGHFAAWEEPLLLADELRASFKSLR
jgi:hypothetical protein